MTEKDITKICTKLKTITCREIIFHDIKFELLDVIRAKHQPDSPFPKHHHPWFEFNYFFEGTFETEMQGKKFVCHNGDSLLIPPGVEHAQKSGPTGDNGICMRWQVSATKHEIDKKTMCFLEAMNHPHPEPLDVDMTPLLSLGENIFLNDSVFLHFILSIYAKWQGDTTNSKPQKWISNQAILYMEEYLQNQILASDVARALNMSYRSLARTFKKETGVSIVEKLNELRINKACKLLTETDLAISKIAEKTGFENIYYFSNTFKKTMRVAPKRFREQNTAYRDTE